MMRISQAGATHVVPGMVLLDMCLTPIYHLS